MSRELLDLIRNRISVEDFDATRTLDEATIRRVVEDATHAPSSFNIQHWRFVAVRDRDDKRRLCEAAYNQQQVADASVVFVLLGDTEAAGKLGETLAPAVESGSLPQGKADAWVRMAGQIYADPALAREEAVRSCSLAAMTLMLSCEARGLVTGALIGFDAARVMELIEAPATLVPVMLLTVGYPSEAHTEQRKTRLPVDAVLSFDRYSG